MFILYDVKHIGTSENEIKNCGLAGYRTKFRKNLTGPYVCACGKNIPHKHKRLIKYPVVVIKYVVVSSRWEVCWQGGQNTSVLKVLAAVYLEVVWGGGAPNLKNYEHS